MEKVKVSIGCIVYNHVHFIRQALDGILMQKTSFPFEILVHDDASTDGTTEIIKEYEKKYPDIIKPIYQKENQYSQNVPIFKKFTLPQITSEYFIFCEGDDYWTDENKLQKQVDFLDKNPDYSTCFHPVIVKWEDHSREDSIFPTPEFRAHKTTLELADILQANFMQTCSVMYRWRKDILDVLPEYFILPVDHFLHMLHAEHGKIAFLPDVMAVYRRHEGGVWAGADTGESSFYTRVGLDHLAFYHVVQNHFGVTQKENILNMGMKTLNAILQKNRRDLLEKYIQQYPYLYKELILQLSTLLKKQTPLKLHLGCGTVYKEGWVNVDNNSDNNISKLDLNWDMRKPLPFPDNSVCFIFNEHFLEHLTVEEGQIALKDFMRVLKKGGIMRIAMPDLKDTIANYLNENYFTENETSLKKYGLTFIKTSAELINIGFRAWGHKWLYDWEELERRLREAGCTHIEKCTIQKSNFLNLQDLENRPESTLIAEIRK